MFVGKSVARAAGRPFAEAVHDGPSQTGKDSKVSGR